jgi:UDP-3-O-[3-hydroxymyristoyl] N-acetylglucosamine deacetylase
LRQGTLARPVVLEGRGLHTGRAVRARVLPRAPDNGEPGVVFRRLRRGKTLFELPVRPEYRLAQPLCTALRRERGQTIRTVEHLLAALLLCEIDHAVVELDAEEAPILDGSALPWMTAFHEAGRAELPAAKRFLRVRRALDVDTGKASSVQVRPDADYRLEVRTHPAGFDRMVWRGAVSPRTFAAEIAPARSYGRVKWALPAIMGGVITGRPILRGARPWNTAAILGRRVVGGMRLPDEFVRHRALDFVGDLALAGAPFLARFKAPGSSHERNHRLLAAILADRDAWEWVAFPPGEDESV